MNNNLENKLKSVFKTLESRLYENNDFFKLAEVDYIYKDRAKKAKIYEDNSYGLIFEFDKKKSRIEGSKLAEVILSNINGADDCRVKYSERGSIITIWTEKNSVKIKTVDDKSDISSLHDDVALRSNRNYIIKAGEADELLKAIGILTNDGKVKNDMIRKYNQIDHFIELIDSMMKELGDKDRITVLDCACGKSYLSFVMNYYIKEILRKPCHFIGVDISEGVIKSSKGIASNLGYKNMEFHQMDIQNYQPDRKIDVVISLHGCDTATDMALAAGIRYNADAIIVVPCCHRELLNQYDYLPFKEILRHGVLKARMADVLTEGIRILLLEAMGYDVSIVEYISPLDTPKNLMIRAIKKQGKNKKAYEEYLSLKEQLGINPTLARLINL